MQQALRLKSCSYQRETYEEWKQLPPSLPRPSTANVAVFLLSFNKLVYLNQSSTNGEQIQLRLLWWGMNIPHRLAYEESNPCKGKYIVCSSNERLLAYLFDMKLLSIEISTKVKAIGKAYLNFTVLKGWKGEMYQGLLDIKQGSKKIGELDYSISIQSMQNPYANQVENEANQGNSHVNLRVSPPSVQQMARKASIRSKQENFSMNDQVNVPKHRTSTSNSHKMYEQDKPEVIRSVKNDKYTSTSRLQFPLEVHHRYNDTNYQTEMIRLIQDYNLLFNKGSKSIFPQDNKQNSVQIEIVKIQTSYKDNTQIQVTVPLIDGNKNYYKLSAGGFIKLQLGNQASQQQLLHYLKQCNMSFRCGQKIEGNIKLSKTLARTNEVLEVQLYQRQGRRQAKKAKGVCFIRAIPPRSNTIIEQPMKEDHQQTDVRTQIKQEEYILINLKQNNPIQKNSRLYNLFLKIANEDKTLGESKTIWNSKLCCFFDEKLTYKIYSNKIIFQLYDRQQSLIRLAIGELALNSPLGVNIEIPLTSKYMNNNVIVGYLSVDYFKNGLESVTKMIPILKNEKEAVKQEHFQQRQKEPAMPKPEPQVVKENIIDQQPEKADIEEQSKQEDKENNIDINTEVKKEQPIKPKQVKKLSLMEIYNKLFTFLHTNSQLLHLLQEKQQHKVTEFLNHFSPIISKNILTISQLNQLISQYLHFSPQHINMISTAAFIDSYEAFSTYYEELIQQKDQLLHTFLLILEGTSMSINDLQCQLRDRKIWTKINLILSNKKSNKINIVQDLKRYYQKKNETFVKYGVFDQLTGSQFCDILRKYEVYETSLGSQINEELLCQKVYRNTIELIQELQPNIELYSYRQLIAFMQQQQIILSEWQILNLREYLSKDNEKKTVPKYPNFNQQPQKNQPTISKSPTFGYLHQPQHKPEPLTSENYMVDSLSVKIQNLAISPINYNSNQTIQGNIRASFSNLTHKIQEMYINGSRISLESLDSISPNNYKSNSISQPQHSQHTQPFKEQRQKDLSNLSQKLSTPSQPLQSYKSESLIQKSHFHLQLATDIAFSYHVQLQLAQLQEPISLQCLHGQWCALATEDGEYLGSICIS